MSFHRHVGFAAAISVTVAFASMNADAAYSGRTVRTFPGSGLHPNVPNSNWQQDTSRAYTANSGSASTYHYAVFPMPWERSSCLLGSDNVDISYNASCSAGQTICVQPVWYNNSGTLTGSRTTACGAGGGGWINSSIPSCNYITLSVAAQINCSLYRTELAWTASGS
jgi:hypothetical protein